MPCFRGSSRLSRTCAQPAVIVLGNTIVIMIGAAAPLRTPLIGPPSGF